MRWKGSGRPERRLNIGQIAVACALGYLDFRYRRHELAQGHAKLATWYEKVLEEEIDAEPSRK